MNNCMKDKNLVLTHFFYHFTYHRPFPIAKLKSLSLQLSHLKKFHLSPLNKQAFVVQTMAFQTKLPSPCASQSHAVPL